MLKPFTTLTRIESRYSVLYDYSLTLLADRKTRKEHFGSNTMQTSYIKYVLNLEIVNLNTYFTHYTFLSLSSSPWECKYFTRPHL